MSYKQDIDTLIDMEVPIGRNIANESITFAVISTNITFVR